MMVTNESLYGDAGGHETTHESSNEVLACNYGSHLLLPHRITTTLFAPTTTEYQLWLLSPLKIISRIQVYML